MKRIAVTKPVVTKRQKIVLASLLLTAGLGILVYLPGLGLPGQVIWLGLVYIVTLYILERDLKKEEWLILPLYPFIWSATCLGWITYTHPAPLISSIALAIFAIGLYGILLAVNIVNIATVRIVPLLRTATTVLHVIGLWCSFFLLYILRTQQPSIIEWVGGSSAITVIIVLPLLWVSCADPGKFRRSFLWSLLVGLVIGQLSLLDAFWPSSFMSSLFLASNTFIFTGLVHYQEQRIITNRAERQYVFLSLLVLLTFYFLTYWGS